MRGIILKDFYESFCLRKNLIGMLFSFAVVTTLVIWMRDAYSYVLLVLLMMPMIGVSTLQYSMEQDEISGYDEILLTFPLTKSEIVLAKLISTWLLALLSNLLISLPLTLLYVFAYHSITIDLGIVNMCAGIRFTIDQHKIIFDRRFYSHVGIGILTQCLIQDRVSDLIADLIRMTFSDAF